MIFISTNKANYLLVGSSNFTKKGFGFEKVKPNAEANLLFNVQNPNERKLRDFLPSDIAEQKIELLKPIASEIKDEDEANFLPQMISHAQYKDGKLTIEFTDECSNADSWEIFLTDEKILDSIEWNKNRKYEKEIPIPDMAKKGLDLEVRTRDGIYYYPIVFNEIGQLIKDIARNLQRTLG